jgi:hypothetical protein
MYAMCGRLVTCVGLLGGLTALALQLDNDWAGQVRDCFSVPRNLVLLQDESVRSDELERKQEGVTRVIARKDEIARAVIAGRLSLREAAALFREAGAGVPYDWDTALTTHPEWSLERRCCQYVISTVEYQLRCEDRDPRPVVEALTREADLVP